MTIRPVLRPRRDRIRGVGPIVNGSDMAPASNHDGGSPRLANFGAQSHGIWSGCLRLAVEVARHHARLASGCWSQLYRTGFEPAGSLRKVSDHSDASSFPSFLRNFVSFAWRYHRSSPVRPHQLGTELWINLELVSRSSCRQSRWRRQDLPSSRGTLLIIRHVPPTPV